MDVDFNDLPDNVTAMFGGWVPAALLKVKHEKTEPKWRVSKCAKIKKLDWPNFTAEPDVEFSGFSKDINIVSIGWEPAAVLNVKHVARRLNAFLTSRYSTYSPKMVVFKLVLEGTSA